MEEMQGDLDLGEIRGKIIHLLRQSDDLPTQVLIQERAVIAFLIRRQVDKHTMGEFAGLARFQNEELCNRASRRVHMKLSQGLYELWKSQQPPRGKFLEFCTILVLKPFVDVVLRLGSKLLDGLEYFLSLVLQKPQVAKWLPFAIGTFAGIITSIRFLWFLLWN
jgi:hypothetical protein